MKRITCLLAAAFSVACLSGLAQTIADIGIDWDGTATVSAQSGISMPSKGTPFTYEDESGEAVFIYQGTGNEVRFAVGGLTASKSYRFRDGSRTDNLTYAPYEAGFR